MRLLRHSAFLAIALSHFSVDVLNSQIGILLTALSGPLGLGNAAIGLIATLYQALGAITQPVFGWLSDRFGEQWLVAGGVVWMAIFFALFAIAPGGWPIIWLVLATLGSAAFHPPGAHHSAQIGQTHMAGKAATAASLFFLFGQGGHSFGPAIGGFIIDQLDRAGLLIVAALVAPVGLFAAWQLRHGRALSNQPGPVSRVEAVARPTSALFTVILLLSGLRAWAQIAATTFVPKLLHDRGITATEYGLVVALFMGGSAVGGVIAGVLADRWGKERTILISFALSIAPLYFLPLLTGGWLYVTAVLAGAFNGSPLSILVTLAQRALPGRGSLASGVTLGFMFAAGAFGSYASGLLADHTSLVLALQLNAALALACALLGLLLKPLGAVAPVVVAGSD